jgi:large subunit ribosomal protein L44e
MKIPKETSRLCPYCKKHTKHKIKQEKNKGKNKSHPMTRSSRSRMRKRGDDRGAGNKGKTSRGAMTKWKRWNKKRSKKTDLRYLCGECRKTHIQSGGVRAKKVVFE